MIIRILKQHDLEDLIDYLGQFAETSMFMLSNLDEFGVEEGESPYSGCYLGAFNEHYELVGMLVHSRNGIIMMQADDHSILGHLVHILKKLFSRPVSGVLGESGQAQVVIDLLGIQQEQFMSNSDEELHVLNLSEFDSRNPGDGYHLVGPGDVTDAILRNWIRAYQIEALGARQDDDLELRVQNQIERLKTKGNYRVLVHHDEPVSLAAFNATWRNMLQIGPVWTPPEHRNQQYARMLLSQMLDNARQDGFRRAILFTDNPAAISSYRSLGFSPIGTYRLALL